MACAPWLRGARLHRTRAGDEAAAFAALAEATGFAVRVSRLASREGGEGGSDGDGSSGSGDSSGEGEAWLGGEGELGASPLWQGGRVGRYGLLVLSLREPLGRLE
jgi:hypothetical protein